MKKIVMVDGNNLLFRSYYATAYTGNFMKNSKGFPTNGLFGFVNMINKIINEEKPEYMVVAFDVGKTFRHDLFETYKEGRIEMPDDLRLQFPIAKEIITNMGLTYLEIDNYEADDIIGYFSDFCDKNDQYNGLIISSDKDLLQLISNQVEIKLLKQKGHIRYDLNKFIEEYQIKPENIVDLKALQGDSSDNIPGVKGIGEKTALKLLQQYLTLDGIYQNLDQIAGKVKEKLENEKEKAYLSYKLATIEKNIPYDLNIKEILVKEQNHDQLKAIFQELEFFSFLKPTVQTQEKCKIVKQIDEVNIKKDFAFYLELDQSNYHKANIIGMAVFNDEDKFFVPKDLIKTVLKKLTQTKFTYDYKKAYVALQKIDVELENVEFDTMIAAYLLDYNLKDDISYLAKQSNYQIAADSSLLEQNAILKAQFVYETKHQFQAELKAENMLKLYEEIDFPISKILANMELTGVCVNQKVLAAMGEEISIKIELLSNEIYNLAGVEFNISSPKQLGPILFEKLGLKRGKKTKTGYSTASDVLESLYGEHPIIEKLIEYRVLTKLYGTYIEGLINTIVDDKIHTIYNQTLTRTGRLSSLEPNLQNIPIRYEYGRLIRKAFIPNNDNILISADYSQIELRVLAHISEVDSLIEAFQKDEDIHTKTAQDIFKTDIINSNQRRMAKAINFGIIYGMSEYGLSQNLNINMKEAKQFIEDYLTTYPGIKNYMDKTIKEAIEKGYTITLFNRKRNITEINNKNYMIRKQGERMALNTPIQGTSADILKMAMILIDDELKKHSLKSKMILQVHDELVFDVLKSEQAKIIEIIKNCMENVYKLKVPLKVDIATGPNWYSTK